ncbi:Hypothetical protein SRAE_X000052400 [Strongyloides ratti]|uniref:Transthyretin-like family-containing protein n=1 Tax=Strongyloides ratti TaxID=34506 RepID=A0A090LSP1_STRRB|nr:Hypothetical protein SRAE_X000052400 [Strongyloides ratti]CEF71197.1 Hypothetical protein SRAE_X000052400 [Strongyloides ratti]
MHLLEIFFLIINFVYIFLTITSVHVRCPLYINSKPPCFLYVDVINDQFFAKTVTILPIELLQYLIDIRKRTSYISNGILPMNKYLIGKINQTTMVRICLKYRVRYQYPTFLRLYTSQPMTRYELNMLRYGNVKKKDS